MAVLWSSLADQWNSASKSYALGDKYKASELEESTEMTLKVISALEKRDGFLEKGQKAKALGAEEEEAMCSNLADQWNSVGQIYARYDLEVRKNLLILFIILR